MSTPDALLACSSGRSRAQEHALRSAGCQHVTLWLQCTFQWRHAALWAKQHPLPPHTQLLALVQRVWAAATGHVQAGVLERHRSRHLLAGLLLATHSMNLLAAHSRRLCARHCVLPRPPGRLLLLRGRLAQSCIELPEGLFDPGQAGDEELMRFALCYNLLQVREKGVRACTALLAGVGRGSESGSGRGREWRAHGGGNAGSGLGVPSCCCCQHQWCVCVCAAAAAAVVGNTVCVNSRGA